MGNNFTQVTKGFCEGTIYGHPPEYLNSVTSLCITLFGAVGLFGSINADIPAKILYAGMVFNGIGSFGYHWTNYMGWRYLDEYSMLLIALGGFISILVNISHKLKLGRNTNLQSGIHNAYKNALYGTLFLITVAYIVISCTLDAIGNIDAFRVLFGSFLLLAVISFIIIGRDSHITYDPLTDSYTTMPEYILKYNRMGLIIIVVASLMWLISELLCGVNNFGWVRYVPGHAIWHIGLGIGGFYLMQFSVYINAGQFGDKHCAEFITSGWYYKLLPRVDYRYLHESLEYII
jgi:hypothetical protein